MDTLIQSVVSINKIGTEDSKPRKSSLLFFGNLTRYVVLAIATFCLSFVLGNAVAFNFTVICMRRFDDPPELVEDGFNNSSSFSAFKHERGSPMFTSSEQSWLFSAVPAGAIVGTIPISYLTSTFGVRKMFVGYGMLSSLATLLTPISSQQSFIWFFVIRLFQGLATSTSYVAMGAISAEWSPISDLGIYLTLISCHFQLAPMVVMPLAGELCESDWGWPALYYILGIASFLSFILFYWFYRDSPRIQRNVSHKELLKIEKGKNDKGPLVVSKLKKCQRVSTQRLPYKEMLTDTAVWGILAANIGATFGNQVFWQFGPVYLHKALGMSITKTGFVSSLPYMLSGLMKLVAGPLSDRMSCMSQKSRVILFSSLSQYTGSLAFIMLVLVSNNYLPITQLCFTAVTAFTGIWTVGVCKSAQMISCGYSHVIFSINTMVSNFVILILPIFVTSLAPSGTIHEWSLIFVIIGVIQAIAQTMFNLTAKVEPRSWATLEQGLQTDEEKATPDEAA